MNAVERKVTDPWQVRAELAALQALWRAFAPRFPRDVIYTVRHLNSKGCELGDARVGGLGRTQSSYSSALIPHERESCTTDLDIVF